MPGRSRGGKRLSVHCLRRLNKAEKIGGQKRPSLKSFLISRSISSPRILCNEKVSARLGGLGCVCALLQVRRFSYPRRPTYFIKLLGFYVSTDAHEERNTHTVGAFPRLVVDS